jgi:hypothetical protein
MQGFFGIIPMSDRGRLVGRIGGIGRNRIDNFIRFFYIFFFELRQAGLSRLEFFFVLLYFIGNILINRVPVSFER